MKNLIYLFAVLACYNSNAQIQVGSNEIATMNSGGRLSEEYMQQLKGTTTLFLLQDRDYDNIIEWENAIKSVWTITPFKIIKRDDLNKYRTQPVSVFSFGGFVVNHRSSSGFGNASSSVHLSYDLWMPHKKNNGEIKGEDYYARLIIYPDNPTMFRAGGSFNSKDLSRKLNSALYGTSTIYNWSPVMLKSCLKTVNDRLLTREHRGPFTEEDDSKALQALKKDTLYIPDYVNIQFSMFGGREKNGAIDMKEVKEYYPYPVRIVTKEELNSIVAAATKPVYYMVFVKSSSDKYLNVFEAQSGKLLFARYSALSFNFKPKDLKDLYKVID